MSQRLITGMQSRRVPAVELMLLTPYLAQLIQKGQIDEMRSAMGKSGEVGMQTFDQSLYDLFSSGTISLDEALAHADSLTDLALRVRLHHGVDPVAMKAGMHYAGEPPRPR